MTPYTKEKLRADIAVDEYLEKYVNIPEFAQKCRQCQSYASSWSCPPFDFDPAGYWRQYSEFHIEGVCIYFDPAECQKHRSQEETDAIIAEVRATEKALLAQKLYDMENDNSISLSEGVCSLCDSCTRAANLPCRYPEKLRYSIEALGGNVGLTCSRLLGLQPEWVCENRLPRKLVIISGLLKK